MNIVQVRDSFRSSNGCPKHCGAVDPDLITIFILTNLVFINRVFVYTIYIALHYLFASGVQRAFLYANDTALIISHKDIEELKIKTYIPASMVEQYSKENDLVLNNDKT